MRERESFVTMFVVVELAPAVVMVDVAKPRMLSTQPILNGLTCLWVPSCQVEDSEGWMMPSA